MKVLNFSSARYASYDSSSVGTAITVGPAPTVTPALPQQTNPDYTNVLYGIVAAVVVAIVIGVVNLLAASGRKLRLSEAINTLFLFSQPRS